MYCSLPDRYGTSRWVRIQHRALAAWDGTRTLLGLLLMFDAFRSVFTPDVSFLGILLRWPGGVALPPAAAFVLGVAILIRHRLCAIALVPFLFLAILNVIEYYELRAAGLVGSFLPFSLFTLVVLSIALARTFYSGPTARWPWRVAGAAISLLAAVFLHIFTFGATDYTRRAEAIVVFGAGQKDGNPSLALEDRVNHGVRLYRAGVAPLLVLSGGPGEPEVMKRLALEGGVPASGIVIDSEGVNTYATLRNLKQRRVVAVSHYYHLARIKLAAGRLGIACATAPCTMSRRLTKEPYYVAREGVALVAYYLLRG